MIIMNNKVFGYIRVSTQEQNTKRRFIALRTPNIIYLFGPLGYKAIFKMRYFKVNFIKIAWL
jgi:hypothetical protein